MQTIMRHSNDATLVQMIVMNYGKKSLTLCSFTSHRMWNPQTVLSYWKMHCSRHSNWMQKELFEKFSSTVCIDSTHGTNAYQFKLITCIVPDDFGKGMWSVGYCKTALHIFKLSHLDVHTKKHESSISHCTVYYKLRNHCCTWTLSGEDKSRSSVIFSISPNDWWW